MNTATTTGNPTDPSGNDLVGLDNPTDDDTAEVAMIDPAIEVLKTPDLQYLESGETATFGITVTNTGDVPLRAVSATDLLAPSRSGPVTAFMDVGDVETYQCTLTNVTADFTNVIEVKGTPSDSLGDPLPGVADVTDDDDAVVDVVAPAIKVVKTAGNAADGEVEYLNGQTKPVAVTYDFVVTNEGDTPLDLIGTGLGLDDNTCTGLVTGPAAGDDSNANDLLDINETWNYTCDHSESDDGLTTNTATVTANPTDDAGNDLPDIGDVSDTDTADIFVVTPAIKVVKTAGNAADGEVEYLNGQTKPVAVTYDFVVTNEGDTPLDLTGTGLGLADNTCTGSVTGPAAGDDSNANDLLDINETWNYTCDHSESDDGLTTNTAIVTANPTDDAGNDLPDISDVSDTDTADIFLVTPAIKVVKTAGNAADGEVEYLNGQTKPVAVTYDFVVTNEGDTPLDLIGTGLGLDDNTCTGSVTGPAAGDDSNVNDLLDINETWNYTCDHSESDDGLTTNTATVTANPTDDAGNDLPDISDVSDTDTADIFVVTPAIKVVKTAGSAADGEVEYLSGLTKPVAVTYDFVVTNEGDTPLDLIGTGLGLADNTCTGSVTGPAAGDDSNVNDLLDINETWNYTCDHSESDDGLTTNTATVTANPTDDAGNDLPDIGDVSDTDTADIFLVNPDITVTKTLISAEPSRPNFEVHFQITIENTGDVWIHKLPLLDEFDTEYLSYGFGANHAVPNSNNNVSDGTIEWDDLTLANPYGFGIDLEPGESFVVDVYFTAEKDTNDIVGPPIDDETVNTAIVDGALADPAGNGTVPPDPSLPVPRDEDWDSVYIEQPTGIRLVSFDASLDSGDALLSWETVAELDMVGFKLLRRSGQGDFSEITGIIPAEHAGAAAGTIYQHTDAALSPGSYTYALLAVKFDGSAKLLATDSVLLRWSDPFVPTGLTIPNVTPSD